MSEHAESVLKAVAGGNAAALTASWRRSLLVHNLRPDGLGNPEFGEARSLSRALERSSALMETAREHLDQLFHAIAGSDHGVFLADHDGVILDKRSGRRHDIWERKPAQWVGVDMSENAEGTNGIGTCLAEKRPVIVLADQHFRTLNGGMTCMGAPIFGPVGELIGCLDVSRPATGPVGLEGLILGTVAEAARRIELASFARAYPKARMVLAVPGGSHPGAVLAVSRDDFVIGATHAARALLGLTAARMAEPFPAQDLSVEAFDQRDADLASTERAAIERALARCRGNVSAAARALGVTRGTVYRKIACYGIRHRQSEAAKCSDSGGF